MAESLWPEDIAQTTIATPAAILKEQAAVLSERTKNTVVAEVVSDTAGDVIVVRFILVAPSLNYRVELLRLQQPLEIYPLVGNFQGRRADILDENTLKEWLKGVFASDRAKRIVQGLISQAIA